MATERWIDSATATPTRPVIGGSTIESHHVLSGVNTPDQEQDQAARERARAARCVIRTAPADAALLLDILGLTHHDAAPRPAIAAALTATDEPPRECPNCRHTKAAAAFYRDRTAPGGRSYWCKTCKNKARAESRRRAAGRNTAA